MKRTKYPCKINDLYSLCLTHSWLQQQAKWRYITDIVQMWANHFARLFLRLQNVSEDDAVRWSVLEMMEVASQDTSSTIVGKTQEGNMIIVHNMLFVNQCIISLTKL